MSAMSLPGLPHVRGSMQALREGSLARLLHQDQRHEQFALAAPDPVRGLLHQCCVAAALLHRMDQCGVLPMLDTRMDTRLDTHWIAPPSAVLKLRRGGCLVHTSDDLGRRDKATQLARGERRPDLAARKHGD